MKEETKKLLLSALEYCDKNDKSVEFTIQYMQDTANVSLDSVLKYLKENRFTRNYKRNDQQH